MADKIPKEALEVRAVAHWLGLWDAKAMDRMGTSVEDGERTALMILRYRARIRRALEIAESLFRNTPMPVSLAAFCYLILSKTSEPRAADFLIALAWELGTGPGEVARVSDTARRHSAPYRLARRLERLPRRGDGMLGRIALAQICALVFKAWGFYRSGIRLKRLVVYTSEPWWVYGEELSQVEPPQEIQEEEEVKEVENEDKAKAMERWKELSGK